MPPLYGYEIACASKLYFVCQCLMEPCRLQFGIWDSNMITWNGIHGTSCEETLFCVFICRVLCTIGSYLRHLSVVAQRYDMYFHSARSQIRDPMVAHAFCVLLDVGVDTMVSCILT